jgi:TolB-like protein
MYDSSAAQREEGLPNHPITESSLPSPESVRDQLQVILASRSFVTATRARRFLTYIVDQTLAGRNDAIKELVLGIEVFDRAGDFDPKVDPIVRVEAGKLRKRLDDYYADEGAAAPLRIAVPKGTYVPLFQVRSHETQVEKTVPRLHRLRFAAGVFVALLLAVSAWWGVRHLRTADTQSIPSIAVLPFLNLSPDPANEYFTDGMAEELTDAICNAGGLRVASRTSAFFFKGKQTDIQGIGAKLHVAFVVEGSVRKQGDQLRVTAQLIRTDDGFHVWSGSFERRMADTFAVQQEIASSVVKVLRVKLTKAESGRLRRAHTANQQAFDLYLQGRHVLNASKRGSIDRAEHLLQQSIAGDPDYAPAYLALAELYGRAGIMANQPAAELYSKTSAAIHKALALDDNLAEAYAGLGMLSIHDYDWAGAERHLRHALDLNPSSSQAHYALAQFVLAPQERWEEALAENRLASELDPLNPVIAYSAAWLAIFQDHDEAAIRGFRNAVAASPEDLNAQHGLAIALLVKGEYPEALEIFRRLQKITPNFRLLASVGRAEAARGNVVEARKILQQFEEAESQGKRVSPICFAVVYLGLADADGSFRYLEKAREEHETATLAYARFFRKSEFIRNDPRYFVLLRELGLSDQQIKKNQQVQ